MFHSQAGLNVLIRSHVQRSVYVQMSNGSKDLKDKMIFFLARPHTLGDLPGPKRMLLHNWHNLFLKPRGELVKQHLCIAAEKSSNLYCLSLIRAQQI